MVSKFLRALRHLSSPKLSVNRLFPKQTLAAIEHAIRDSEKMHGGQICFIIEAALSLKHIVRGVSARARAVEVFSELRLWDTEHNNAVLIYLLLAERNIEIIADRGARKVISNDRWEEVCREIEHHLRKGSFEKGIISGIQRISAMLATHFPPSAKDKNELPDKPRVL